MHRTGTDTMSTTVSDEEAVERARSGDRESYGLLAMRHQRRLERVALGLLRDPADAEDAVQGAHLLALQHFDQYEGRSPYVHWMTTITLNEARTGYRRNRIGASSEELQDRFAAPAPNPEQAAIGKDLRRIVGRALDRIPPEYSTVFRMREMAELSTAETGRCLGLTEACVKSRLHRARALLRRLVGGELCGGLPRRAARASAALSGFGELIRQTGSVA